MSEAERLLPCHKCGGECRVETFGPNRVIETPFPVWVCRNVPNFGGTCGQDRAYLSAEEWNKANGAPKVAMTEAERLAELLTAFSRKGHTPNERPWRELVDNSATLIRQQSARIAALEEALRFYARENCWRSSGVYMSGKSQASQAELDRGNKARKALGKGSE